MEIGKKGMFFSLIAITLVSLFILSYSIYSYSEEQRSVEKRVEGLNSFVFSFETDLRREMYIAGFRSIFIFEKKIGESLAYVGNVSTLFSELFFNGTYQGNSETLMIGATFSDIANSSRDGAARMNIDVNLSNPAVVMSQTNPWTVNVTLFVDVLISDRGNLAYWEKREGYSAEIPVESFEDPLYFVSTVGQVVNRVNKTAFFQFAAGSDVSNLTIHSNDSDYKASTTAPCFIDRLEGRNSPSAYGIESLVNLEVLSIAGISVEEKSCVDYIYFSSSWPESKKITGMPYWFRLDTSHVDDYNVSGLEY